MIAARRARINEKASAGAPTPTEAENPTTNQEAGPTMPNTNTAHRQTMFNAAARHIEPSWVWWRL